MLKTILVSGLCALGLSAQTTNSKEPVTREVPPLPAVGVAPFGTVTAAIAGPMTNIAGAPYSAQAVTERVQTLADGNRIEQSSSGSVARDSRGRVRRDETLPALGDAKGEAPHMIFIEDPVAGVHWNLDARTKTAFKMSFGKKALTKAPSAGGAHDNFVFAQSSAPSIGVDQTFFFSEAPAPKANGQIVTRIQPDTDAQVNRVDLGTQTMEGVAAQGTRITRTIPAGAVGNQLPLVITTETWYSPDLKVLVMSKTSDPRMGETTYRLTDIQRADPPASLFEVPDDYTIRDSPAYLTIRDIKKTP